MDRYYAVRPPRSEQTALDVARDVGADVQRLAACIESDETSRILSEDIALGRSAGVRATPTLLVNGWTFEGALPRARLVEILHDTGPCGCDRRGPDGSCGGERRN
ncbi:MAG: thioredoxin domain-containing protein [Myxococcales bacterium]|nr:thioredoxin domain-containing protein [Myxococcales bacterium]